GREKPQQHRLGDDAAARVRVTDDEDPSLGRLGDHIPPPKMSPMVSGLVMPSASFALSTLPSSAASQISCFGFWTFAAECQPFMGHTVRPPTRKTWPLQPAASSDASQATSGEMFCGPQTSNSPALTSPPMRPAVDGVASTVRRVRATGAMAFAVTPYFFISWPMMMAMVATAAL